MQQEQPEIQVVIEKSGDVRLEVNGVPGFGCFDLTRDLEAALGNSISERQATADAFRTLAGADQSVLGQVGDGSGDAEAGAGCGTGGGWGG
jgi:hypothetical protein